MVFDQGGNVNPLLIVTRLWGSQWNIAEANTLLRILRFGGIAFVSQISPLDYTLLSGWVKL